MFAFICLKRIGNWNELIFDNLRRKTNNSIKYCGQARCFRFCKIYPRRINRDRKMRTHRVSEIDCSQVFFDVIFKRTLKDNYLFYQYQFTYKSYDKVNNLNLHLYMQLFLLYNKSKLLLLQWYFNSIEYSCVIIEDYTQTKINSNRPIIGPLWNICLFSVAEPL